MTTMMESIRGSLDRSVLLEEMLDWYLFVNEASELYEHMAELHAYEVPEYLEESLFDIEDHAYEQFKNCVRQLSCREEVIE